MSHLVIFRNFLALATFFVLLLYGYHLPIRVYGQTCLGFTVDFVTVPLHRARLALLSFNSLLLHRWFRWSLLYALYKLYLWLDRL